MERHNVEFANPGHEVRSQKLEAGIRAALLLVPCFYLLLFNAAPSKAQLIPVLGAQRVGITALDFLKIGIGARANAMAESFAAVDDDAYALFYNPAGITEFDKTEIAFSHSTWFVGLQHDFIGGVYHLDSQNSFGVSIISLQSDDMLVTTEFQPTGTGAYFRYGDLALAATYARKMTDKFSFGVSVKFVDETLAELSMRGVLIDLGTFYWTGLGTTRFAVSVSNFGGQLTPSGSVQLVDGTTVSSFQSFSPPTFFRIGFAFEPYQDETNKLTTSAQLNHPGDNSENIALGAEYSYDSSFFLRAGYKINVDEQNYSLGAGVKIDARFALVYFDYAFTPYQRLGDVHRFSLNLRF
ncbi:MAG TPA: PorV/PorQ family protein [Candidatus Acidoferrales bacterium]|nr:PorV/PorQ family protein [Candidatus Acidoferrales bacterium]